jgi:hypothetical protein
METQQILSFGKTSSVDRKPSRFVFEQLVNEAIDNVLSSLGTVCKQAIYDCLGEKYKLKKNDFANHVLEFSEALEQIFGDAATLLEIEMMRRLCQKVPQFRHSQEGMLTFPDYVNALSRFICR